MYIQKIYEQPNIYTFYKPCARLSTSQQVLKCQGIMNDSWEQGRLWYIGRTLHPKSIILSLFSSPFSELSSSFFFFFYNSSHTPSFVGVVAACYKSSRSLLHLIESILRKYSLWGEVGGVVGRGPNWSTVRQVWMPLWTWRQVTYKKAKGSINLPLCEYCWHECPISNRW